MVTERSQLLNVKWKISCPIFVQVQNKLIYPNTKLVTVLHWFKNADAGKHFEKQTKLRTCKIMLLTVKTRLLVLND